MRLTSIGWFLISICSWSPLSIADDLIPHAQDKPPNDPRDPQTAAKMMTVPEGFTVEVVAHEPDIVNPVAMTFDEKGRVWITESLEYPRREPGPGKDRVKILEDADGDGKMDKFSIFLDGLNIPSGVAVGHGGVWVANSPDILFVPDKDRDGKPDGEPEVVVTGFGRTDTHELPNSLTWGPDGWLYGLNGVFNHSHVKYPTNNPNYEKAGGDKQPGWPVTCAMFRIHPRTREFQVFAEGTSNPWGIAFNDEGDAFVSACVIDHLWHIVETGYYHRQGGPYPPHTWKIESIVEHKHQKAAYCGITWFDSDAYPEKYRKKLYMGNIHGGCINVDRIERNGSTYKGFGEPDFLTANDAWFMPVVQKTGPDGCLWILDWYDRYHCYQDANRDPAGIDRLKGRLYRVRYIGAGSVSDGASKKFDLATETDDELIEKLGHPNVWLRETAQRILTERRNLEILPRLDAIIFKHKHVPPGGQGSDHYDNDELPHTLRAHALWTRTSICEPDDKFFTWLSWSYRNDFYRAWFFRTAGDSWRDLSPDAWLRKMKSYSQFGPNWDSEVLQYIIAHSKRAPGNARIGMVHRMSGGKKPLTDPLRPHIIWRAMQPVLAEEIETWTWTVWQLNDEDVPMTDMIVPFLARSIRVLVDSPQVSGNDLGKLLTNIVEAESLSHGVLAECLATVSEALRNGLLKDDRLEQLREQLEKPLKTNVERRTSADVKNEHRGLLVEAAILRALWGDEEADRELRRAFDDPQTDRKTRIDVMQTLLRKDGEAFIASVDAMLSVRNADASLQAEIISSLSGISSPQVPEILLHRYPTLNPEIQPKAIELLTQRAGWAKSLLKAIGEKKLSADVININQARRLRELKDEELSKLLQDHWGDIRDSRNPDREKIVAEMRTYIRRHKGDELNGEKVFKKVCGQCHKLYGEGAEVGPDITRNGRNDYQQLLSNVFDPSLVIGAGYRSYTVLTNGGRVVNGLLVEESPQRVVLKIQGGKQEIVPRDDIDEFNVSELSLMPEQLEKQITPPEIADLFAYITLDKPPSDPEAKRLAGVYEIAPRETTNPAEFAAVFQEIAPGFTSVTSGERGVGLLAEYRGRKGVVRTHPVSKDKAAIMKGKFVLPKDQKTTLILDVSHDDRGDWRLLAGGNGERLLDEMISKETCPNGWATFRVDLSKFAGREVEIQLWNQANNWSWEYGYWGEVRIVSE